MSNDGWGTAVPRYVTESDVRRIIREEARNDEANQPPLAEKVRKLERLLAGACSVLKARHVDESYWSGELVSWFHARQVSRISDPEHTYSNSLQREEAAR